MSNDEVCKLCKNKPAIEEDLEKAKFKSVNKLLQRLFECYKIDVSSKNASIVMYIYVYLHTLFRSAYWERIRAFVSPVWMRFRV